MFHDRSFPPPRRKRFAGGPRRFLLPIVVTSFGLVLIAAALAGADLRVLDIGSAALTIFVLLYAVWVAGRR